MTSPYYDNEVVSYACFTCNQWFRLRAVHVGSADESPWHVCPVEFSVIAVGINTNSSLTWKNKYRYI